MLAGTVAQVVAEGLAAAAWSLRPCTSAGRARSASLTDVIGPLLYRNDETPLLPDLALVLNRKL